MSQDPERAVGSELGPGASPADVPLAAAGSSRLAGHRAQLRSSAMMAVFDIGGPLAAYSLLRSHGFSAVMALILSGAFPAVGVVIGVVQHRRLDVVGAMVLGGILVGTVIGLISHNARLVLVEGSVPTALFGVACLGSLWARRPLLLAFALEFTGRDTARGREMSQLWQYREFRHLFRVMTVVWGVGYLVEAALRVVIVEHTSTGTALASSKVTPFIFAAILGTWTAIYGARAKRRGERIAAGFAAEAAAFAAQAAAGQAQDPASPAEAAPGSAQRTPHSGAEPAV